MIAWIALGLVVLIAVFLVLGEIRRRQAALAPTPAPQPERDQVRMSDEQRLQLQNVWPHVVCAHCGCIHEGACPRIRETRYFPNGTVRRLIYWRDEEWEFPQGIITVWDVYGAAGRPPPEPEGEAA